jgi:3-phosphoshikimate 1-carboxyvinyltransferase
VLGEICGDEVTLDGSLPRDVELLRLGLAALRTSSPRIDCEDAGAPFRFLLAQAALTRHRRIEFVGTPRLAERPHQPLIEALTRSLDVEVTPQPLAWPLTVVTRERSFTGSFRVEGGESSQFVSSLVLGAARLVREEGRPVSIQVERGLTSRGYLSMTLRWLERFGFSVEATERGVAVLAWRRVGVRVSIPGDWSSLTYLLPLAWKTGLEVERVDRSAEHPDAAFASILERAGLTLTEHGPHTTVTGSLQTGLSADASECPDSIPALVAVAMVAPGPSRFERCAVLRLKESDRLGALIELVGLVGGRARLEGDRLTVAPGSTPRSASFDARGDHRLVMAAAVLGALANVAIDVRGTSAVAKSFPDFWTEAAKAGVPRREAP